MPLFPESPEVNDTHTVKGREFIYDSSGRWMPNWGGTGAAAMPTVTSLGNAGSALEINRMAADVQRLTLNSASCTFTFSADVPASGEVFTTTLVVKHDGTTSSRAIVWPTLRWDNATAPFTPTTTANAESWVSLVVESDGTTTGFHGGNYYP